MSKRGNGEGSIFHRKDGKWTAAVSVPQPNGKSKRVFHYSKSRRKCATWLTEMLEKIRLGGISVNSDMLLTDWLRQWKNEYCINIKDSTRMNYETYIERHISCSEIGKKALNHLTTNDLQTYCKYLYESGRLDGKGGLNAKTVRNQFNMIHAALKQAVGNGLILNNPADFVVLPKTSKCKAIYLNIEEQKNLMDVSKDEYWNIGIRISLETGIRIGELLALRSSDIKSDKGIYYLDIKRSLQRVTDFNDITKGKQKTILREGKTKTENSQRIIPISPKLKAAIDKSLIIQAEEAEKNHKQLIPDPFIIANGIGNHIDPSTYRNWFKKQVKNAGLDENITPHKLRHTFASTALRYGMDLKNISSLLGHYSTDFTARTYVHTDIEGQFEALMEMFQNKKDDEEKKFKC